MRDKVKPEGQTRVKPENFVPVPRVKPENVPVSLGRE